ncbi:hypothetical protein BASA61_008956 [Batrachochytrium salamandrivorans]|nr:hypothetical protein BASA61_008956 [Batrachochytrium salamandrivorans]
MARIKRIRGTEEQAKSKVSVPNPDSSQKPYVHTKDTFDFYKSYKPGDNTQEGPANFPEYVLTQDRGAKGARKKVHTGIASNQGGSSFMDTPEDSSSQVLGRIKKELSRAKLQVRLFASRQQASDASDKAWLYFGGQRCGEIRRNVRSMLNYAAKVSQSHKALYKDPVKSPFILELLSSTSDELKKEYKSLQDEVRKSIKDHVSDIMHAVKSIIDDPKKLISWLENMMSSADSFYVSISNMRAKYSRLLEELRMSGSGHLEKLDAHMTILTMYKTNLSDRMEIIKKLIEETIKPQTRRTRQSLYPSTLDSKGRSEIGSKPSDDVASGSAPSEDGVVYDLISVD